MSHRIQSAIYPEGDPRLWPLFPGFEAAFACNWPEQPVHTAAINPSKLIDAVNDLDQFKRTGGVVDLYILETIDKLQKHDEVLTPLYYCFRHRYQNCRPKSIVTEGTGYKVSSTISRERGSGKLAFWIRTIPRYLPRRFQAANQGPGDGI